MTLPDNLIRAYRWLVRPINRWSMGRRDRRRLTRWIARSPVRKRLPVFVVVMPRTLGWLEPCLKLVPADVPLVLVTNGLSRAERRRLEDGYPGRAQFPLSLLPGSHRAML